MTTRNLPKSMVGIFNDLHSNRSNQAAATRNATKHFAVVSLTKKGTPSRIDASTMQYSATETMEQAEAKRADMERLNPGKTFVIVTL